MIITDYENVDLRKFLIDAATKFSPKVHKSVIGAMQQMLCLFSFVGKLAYIY